MYSIDYAAARMICLHSSRKPRPSLKTNSCVIAPLAAMLAVMVSSVPGQTAELLDRRFFTSDRQGLVTANNARITGKSGTSLELNNDGSVNVLSGTCTISTRSQAQNMRAGTLEISIPPSSKVTIRNHNGTTVSTNESSSDNTTGISSGGSQIGKLHSGETYPQGEALLTPIVARGSLKTPLFSVGNGELQLSQNSDDTVSLVAGEQFFLPSRALIITTPLGQVVAGAHSAFLVSVSAGSVRVFNCRSGPVKFNKDQKFRKILNAEEFCVFDHRPTKEEILPVDGIGRKEITLHDLDNERTTASTNIFSVISLLTSPNYLGDWKRTSEPAKKLESSVIKSTAAYGGANPNSEAFYRTPADPVDTRIRQ